MRKFSSLLFSLIFLASCVFLPLPLLGEGTEHDGDHTKEQLMRGERLFYGLVDGKFETKACADCHNTVEIDTFNWNPNAWEIASKYKHLSLEEFQDAVLNPTSQTMLVMHQTLI
jgi:formate-dependent nitrite reductase cytochrome c552 subunit